MNIQDINVQWLAWHFVCSCHHVCSTGLAASCLRSSCTSLVKLRMWPLAPHLLLKCIAKGFLPPLLGIRLDICRACQPWGTAGLHPAAFLGGLSKQVVWASGNPTLGDQASCVCGACKTSGSVVLALVVVPGNEQWAACSVPPKCQATPSSWSWEAWCGRYGMKQYLLPGP